MSDTDTTRLRIVQASSALFFSRGFAKVTVDEIAGQLGISKKTLYQHFASKDELLKAVVRGMINAVAAEVEALINDERMDFIDQLIGLMRLLTARISQLSKPFADDMQRHAPELWREVQQFRHRKVMANFGRLVRTGQQLGAFRKDVDPELLTVIFAATVQGVVNPQTLAQLPYTASQLFQAIGKTMFIGIFTEKAKLVHFHKLKKLQKEISHG
ncbi:MAG TPA: TetR/AcrR family transcriptional regulator [Candidatus Edwardsbacteria bacterium]|nr:TetR/AcrR family transcriptional regulator [Candidatus Edwardsbacteria bacterium]